MRFTVSEYIKMLRQNPRKFVHYFCSKHGKIVALQVHLLGRLFIDASGLMSDSYFSVSPSLSLLFHGYCHIYVCCAVLSVYIKYICLIIF